MAVSGPLPSPSRRRRNAPTFPTTRLPIGGYTGPIPKSPIVLGDAGRAFWRYAWRTPQAAAWNKGHVWTVARRAELEDVWSGMETKSAAMAGAMAALDARLGLTPEAMQRLRWEIVADVPAAKDDDRSDATVVDEGTVGARRAARAERGIV